MNQVGRQQSASPPAQPTRTPSPAQDRSGLQTLQKLIGNRATRALVSASAVSAEDEAAMRADLESIVAVLREQIVDADDEARILGLLRKWDARDRGAPLGTTPHLDRMLLFTRTRSYSRSTGSSAWVERWSIVYDDLWRELEDERLEAFKALVARSRTQGTKGPTDEAPENFWRTLGKQEAVGMFAVLKQMGVGVAGMADDVKWAAVKAMNAAGIEVKDPGSAAEWLAQQYDITGAELLGKDYTEGEELFWGMNAKDIGAAGGEVVWQLMMMGKGAGGNITRLLDLLGSLHAVETSAQTVATRLDALHADGQITLDEIAADRELQAAVLALGAAVMGAMAGAKGANAQTSDAARFAAQRMQLLMDAAQALPTLGKLVDIWNSNLSPAEKRRAVAPVLKELLQNLIQVAMSGKELAGLAKSRHATAATPPSEAKREVQAAPQAPVVPQGPAKAPQRPADARKPAKATRRPAKQPAERSAPLPKPVAQDAQDRQRQAAASHPEVASVVARKPPGEVPPPLERRPVEPVTLAGQEAARKGEPAPVAPEVQRPVEAAGTSERSMASTVRGKGDAAAAPGTERAATSADQQHEAAMAETLRADMGPRPPPSADVPADAPPVRTGEVVRRDVPTLADARRIYDEARARAPGREVAIFRNRNTGEYAVTIGNEVSVSSPRGNFGEWEGVQHFHPNEANVLTYRNPAPQDVNAAQISAALKQGPHTELIEHPLPDGTRAYTAYTAHPDGHVTIEFQAPDGTRQVRSFESLAAFEADWGSRKVAVDPDPKNPVYQQLMRNVDEHYRNREVAENAAAGERTMVGKGTSDPQAQAEPRQQASADPALHPNADRQSDPSRPQAEPQARSGAAPAPKLLPPGRLPGNVQKALERAGAAEQVLKTAQGKLVDARQRVEASEAALKVAKEWRAEDRKSPEAKVLLDEAKAQLAAARAELRKVERDESLSAVEHQEAQRSLQNIVQIESDLSSYGALMQRELHPPGGFGKEAIREGRSPGVVPMAEARLQPSGAEYHRLAGLRKTAESEIASEMQNLTRTVSDQIARATPGEKGQPPAMENAKKFNLFKDSKPLDVVTGKPMEAGEWEADHIMSRAEIGRDERFLRLTPVQREALLTGIPENFLPMHTGANRSKQDKTMAEWIAYLEVNGNRLPDDTAKALLEADRIARKAVEKMFNEFTSKP